MKYNMNKVITMIALLMLTSIGAWAEQQVSIVKKPTDAAGTVTAAVANGVCTLTVTPAEGYYLAKENLTAVTTLDGSAVQVARRAGGITISEGTQLTISGDGIAAADAPATFTFTMPEDQSFNVEVTAEFQEKLAAGLAWDKESVETTFDAAEKIEFPVLTNPNELSVSYASSDESVATIDAQGEVTVVGTGETTISAAFAGSAQYTAATVEYVLTVTGVLYKLKIDGKIVTEENRKSLFGNTVIYDGKATLTLDNAHISGIESGLDELIIYLKGANTIASDKPYAILDMTEGRQRLEILTDQDQPGSLTMQVTTTEENRMPVVSGFNEITLRNPLAVLSPEGQQKLNQLVAAEVELGVAVTPIVLNAEQEHEINYVDNSEVGGASNLSNIVIDNVLYTMNDDGTAGSSDGFDQTRSMVVLNSMVTLEELAAAKQLVPGTTAFAEKFKGLTFLVPPGSGDIIVSATTAEGHSLHIVIGDNAPYVMSTHGEMRKDTVKYSVTVATYVYIYHVANGAAAAPGHRIGPKPAVSTGVSGVKVAPIAVDAPPATQDDYLCLQKGDISVEGRHIIVNNQKVTDLADDVFSEVFGASGVSRRAATGDITYIDLRGTSVTGKNYSREEGPLKDVPEHVFVYLPAGNTSWSTNVVIGTVCPRLEAGDGDLFEMAAGFTAAKATLHRSYQAGVKYPVCFPFAVDNPEEYGQFFVYGGIDTGVFQMKKAGKVEANMGYYMEPKADLTAFESQNVKLEKTTASATTGVVGTLEKLTNPADAYYYDNGSKTFKKADASTVVLPFEAYLLFSNTASAIPCRWEGDPEPEPDPEPDPDPTGINEVGTGTIDSAPWFTIDGRRLNGKPQSKGIYLHQGKKVIVK